MLDETESRHVAEFFTDIERWGAAYKHAGLSYFAVKHENEHLLLQGRLFLRNAPPSVPETHFQSSSIRVGHYPLSDLHTTPREFVERIGSGTLQTPQGTLRLPSNDSVRRLSANYTPFHRDGRQSGSRLSVLTLTGATSTPYVHQPQYDWELKAAPTPYDNLNELLFEYALGAFDANNFAALEIIAFPACEVDLNARVNGATAAPAVLLADQLSPNKCRLGYRVYHQGKVVTRASIDGAAMRWERREHVLHGSAAIDVPRGAILHCTAIYEGHAQHQGWITDPSTVQNPNRAVYEAFDRQMVVLRDFLENSQGKGRDARDLEAGVAWLLWMLGFGVAHLGGTAKTQDAPDLVATTPGGNFVVIECTTGLLKADNKLPRVIERAETIRQRLDASGNRHLRVMPVMVSSKSREEVKADLEQAEKLGVLVLTKESLSQAIDRTLVPQDAEQIYAEGERVVREQQRKYSQPQLPLGGA